MKHSIIFKSYLTDLVALETFDNKETAIRVRDLLLKVKPLDKVQFVSNDSVVSFTGDNINAIVVCKEEDSYKYM